MTILYSEMREEAERLSRTLKRNVEVDCVSCDCDYSKLCYLCAGEGRYFRLVFGSCNHSVDDLDACEENNCASRERREAEASRVFPIQAPQLRSLSEANSEELAEEALA